MYHASDIPMPCPSVSPVAQPPAPFGLGSVAPHVAETMEAHARGGGAAAQYQQRGLPQQRSPMTLPASRPQQQQQHAPHEGYEAEAPPAVDIDVSRQNLDNLFSIVSTASPDIRKVIASHNR